MWWLESITRLESQILVTLTRLESHFSQNDSARVTINVSRLESQSFLQNLSAPDGQTQFVCTQRNEQFLLQWWSVFAQIFCFACLVALCYVQRWATGTLKIIAALPLPLLKNNSSELSLPLFATATFSELLKLVLFCRSKAYFTLSPWNVFLSYQFVDCPFF